MEYRLWVIGCCLLLGTMVWAADSTKVAEPIYQGVIVKLDIASPVIQAGISKGQLQHYEIAANVRLKNRFYPTLELGLAGGKANQGDSVYYNAYGGFFRAGCDINPIRRNPKSPHAMLIGVRIGTGLQAKKTDCWGEVVAGCQVEICKVGKTAFYMGWQGRLKILFTRQSENVSAAEMWPIYIPGFGKRSDVGWGASYHLGWRF